MPNPLPPSVNLLEVRLGLAENTLADEDKDRAEAALADATTLALAEVPSAKATVWALNAPNVVQLVILRAARREFQNPRGVVNESQADHAATLSETSVYLTDSEIKQIRRAGYGRSGGFVGTVYTPPAYPSRIQYPPFSDGRRDWTPTLP